MNILTKFALALSFCGLMTNSAPAQDDEPSEIEIRTAIVELLPQGTKINELRYRVFPSKQESGQGRISIAGTAKFVADMYIRNRERPWLRKTLRGSGWSDYDYRFFSYLLKGDHADEFHNYIDEGYAFDFSSEMNYTANVDGFAFRNGLEITDKFVKRMPKGETTTAEIIKLRGSYIPDNQNSRRLLQKLLSARNDWFKKNEVAMRNARTLFDNTHYEILGKISYNQDGQQGTMHCREPVDWHAGNKATDFEVPFLTTRCSVTLNHTRNYHWVRSTAPGQTIPVLVELSLPYKGKPMKLILWQSTGNNVRYTSSFGWDASKRVFGPGGDLQIIKPLNVAIRETSPTASVTREVGSFWCTVVNERGLIADQEKCQLAIRPCPQGAIRNCIDAIWPSGGRTVIQTRTEAIADAVLINGADVLAPTRSWLDKKRCLRSKKTGNTFCVTKEVIGND